MKIVWGQPPTPGELSESPAFLQPRHRRTTLSLVRLSASLWRISHEGWQIDRVEAPFTFQVPACVLSLCVI